MRFELFIAARYLRAKRRQAVVGDITAISVIGVAAGVASLIIALAITTGVRGDQQNRLRAKVSPPRPSEARRTHARPSSPGPPTPPNPCLRPRRNPRISTQPPPR